MPRVSILDSILNRPSQSYTPEVIDNNNQRRHNGGITFAPPPDLPNAKGAPSSILSGSMFRRKPSRSFSGMSSDAGRSAAGSISGGSRLGRNRTSRDYGSQYAPSSVADSSATKKSRWWETGSMTFGRRSRAPSISGNSIFSEPAEDGLNGWPNMNSIKSSNKNRVSQSDYGGGSRSRINAAPPMPKLDDRYYHAQSGRLQSNVAPLGSSSLNPTLTKKPSKSRVSSTPIGYGGSIGRVSSPPPGRAMSPPPRPLSPTFSDSGRSMRSMTNLQTGAQDWKDFVKGMSGSAVSRVWEGDANVSNIGAALNNSKATNTAERRKSNMVRLQKELEQDSQHEQIVRDPGIIRQDLLARAASQVVGGPPATTYGDADLLGSAIRPGSIVSPPNVAAAERSRSPPPVQQRISPDASRSNNGHAQSNGVTVAQIARSSPRAAPVSLAAPVQQVQQPVHQAQPVQPAKQQEEPPLSESESDDGEDGSSEEGSDSEESERKRQHLAVVDEEEEDTSSVGHEMRPQQTPTVSESAAAISAAKYKAFDAALKRSSTLEQPAGQDKAASPMLARANPYNTTGMPPTSTSPSPSQSSPAVNSIPHSPAPASVESLPKIITTSASKDITEGPEDEVFVPAARDSKPSSIKESTDGLQVDAPSAGKDDSDARSINSTQTGKATVKFDQEAKDDAHSVNSDGTISRPKSLSASTRTGSRPPTLSRRLSDVSMGTSFGMSGIIRDSSRSSVRMRMVDNDSDSAKSDSEEEGDDDFKAKIKAEQARLRSMKVGEDFFGGSLSSILDKFGAGTFDDEPRNTVGQLDLDVGSSGRANGGTMSTQEILSANAQERINEVRRLRSDSSRSIRTRRDNSDAMTVQSGIAPSFAAIWLLNQDAPSTPPAMPASPPAPTRAPPPAPTTPLSKSAQSHSHSRHLSTASSDGGNGSSSTSRLRNFFNNKSAAPAESTVERKTSVMDRPRNRGPKPRQMGGVPISQGKLAADSIGPEVLEDTRSTLPALVNSLPLSYMKEAQQQAEAVRSPVIAPAKSVASTISIASPVSPSSPASMPPPLPVPSSPAAPTVAVTEQPASKDKPAPKKSALKPKKTKSLADTLFSFTTTSPKKKARNAEAKEAKVAKKAQLDEAKSMKSSKSLDSISGAAEVKAAQRTTPTRTRSGSGSVYATPDKELDAYSQFPSSDKLSTFHTAQDLSQPKATEEYIHPLQRREGSTAVQRPGPIESDAEEEEWEPALSNQPARLDPSASPDDALVAKDDGPPSSSEVWSAGGDSIASTGPTTPGASDILERYSSPPIAAHSQPTLIARRSDSPGISASPSDKKLPMPPVPTFKDYRASPALEGDTTPLAVTRPNPIYTDYNKTPMAEAVEPSFGLNLIPPTPPALESRQSYTSMTSQTLMSAKPDTVMEHPEEDGQSPGSSKTRSSSSDTAKKGTKKKGILAKYPEYQGRGINLPPGLVATTVASSASRRQQSDAVSRPGTAASEPSTDGTIKRKKKASSSRSPSQTYADTPSEADSSEYSDTSHRRSSPALRESLAEAPPVPTLPASTSNLAIPSSRSETNSSNGSDSMPRSYSGSASPSPAPSVSGRSAISSSNASQSAASELSNSRFPRKIRTLSAAPNGQARTSLMSAISEWESSSPVDGGRGGAMSPMPPYIDSSRSDLYHARSPSSINMGSAASSIRGETYLNPRVNGTRAASGHTESLDGHSGARPWRASYVPSVSDMSGLGREQSSLTMPYIPSAPQSQAGYRPHDATKVSNTIDERLYAKTTMATISVTSGAFRTKSLKKRKSVADVAGLESARSSRVSIDSMPDGLVEELQRTKMSLTAHTPPPRKLTSTQVLVQIMTCAIDETDRQLLREKIRNDNAYGFVPGRSFCGRVMETGWEVKRMRKGDVVFGLQSSRKCGALAEFMTIDQDLIVKAPEDCLTTEEIAALPAVGVMAYQMMTNHCSQLKRGSRILILNAHDGVGLLTMQEAADLGLIIVAQCPENVSDGVALCEANGANEVVIGEPLWALNSLHESSFDLVLDTVGGRRVYDAARRILAYQGQFCTCVGDMSSSVNPNLKSHLRSLRRSFFKKDTKHIGYEWIAVDVGEDCREALESVKLAAEKGLICPRLQSILSFADAPRAFEVTLRGGQTEPGSVVVKVS